MSSIPTKDIKTIQQPEINVTTGHSYKSGAPGSLYRSPNYSFILIDYWREKNQQKTVS